MQALAHDDVGCAEDAAARNSGGGCNTIQTYGGTYFDLTEPGRSEIDIQDIAVALSNTCRYGGHTVDFYSVAQHSVLASRLVPHEDALAALMHDAAEAYTGDVVKPLKRLLPEFAAIETRIEAAIARKFGLAYPWPESVKRADLMLLKRERIDLMPLDGGLWPGMEGIENLVSHIHAWPPQRACNCFLDRFYELTCRVDAPSIARGDSDV
jgi:hypothetical protein